MISLIVSGHEWCLNKQGFDLWISRINIISLLHMRVKQISKACHRILLSHLFKHLQQLHSLSLCEINVAMYGVTYSLNDATKSTILQTQSKLAIDTIDNHWHGEATLKIHLNLILYFYTLKHSSFINCQWVIMLHNKMVRSYELATLAVWSIRPELKGH